MARLGKTLDRMESRGNEYFERVRNGFLLESERWPDTVDVIDATRTPDEIQNDIRKLAMQYIKRKASN
jgi:dTMP kinase